MSVEDSYALLQCSDLLTKRLTYPNFEPRERVSDSIHKLEERAFHDSDISREERDISSAP